MKVVICEEHGGLFSQIDERFCSSWRHQRGGRKTDCRGSLYVKCELYDDFSIDEIGVALFVERYRSLPEVSYNHDDIENLVVAAELILGGVYEKGPVMQPPPPTVERRRRSGRRVQPEQPLTDVVQAGF